MSEQYTAREMAAAEAMAEAFGKWAPNESVWQFMARVALRAADGVRPVCAVCGGPMLPVAGDPDDFVCPKHCGEPDD